jgi:hypothetical protein
MNCTARRNCIQIASLFALIWLFVLSADVRAQGLDTYLDEDPKTHWDNLVAPALRRGDDDAPELVQEHWDLFHDRGYGNVGGPGAWDWFEREHPQLASNWKKKQWKKAKKKFQEGDPGALDWALELWEFRCDQRSRWAGCFRRLAGPAARRHDCRRDGHRQPFVAARQKRRRRAHRASGSMDGGRGLCFSRRSGPA